MPADRDEDFQREWRRLEAIVEGRSEFGFSKAALDAAEQQAAKIIFEFGGMVQIGDDLVAGLLSG